jgi:hypothetical protein
MNFKSVIVLMCVLMLSLAVFAQESETSPQSDMPMTPPQPLNNDWQNWLIGEWQGTSESTMGKSDDWMKIEKGIDGQFLIMHYTGKTIEIKPDALKQMAKEMNISEDQAKEIAHQEYKGLGITTVNPMSGEIMGYWFDSYRDVSEGKGSYEGNTSTITWTSKYMGTMKRTTEKLGDNKMKITFSGKDTKGNPYEGSAIMTRVNVAE